MPCLHTCLFVVFLLMRCQHLGCGGRSGKEYTSRVDRLTFRPGGPLTRVSCVGGDSSFPEVTVRRAPRGTPASRSLSRLTTTLMSCLPFRPSTVGSRPVLSWIRVCGDPTCPFCSGDRPSLFGHPSGHGGGREGRSNKFRRNPMEPER